VSPSIPLRDNSWSKAKVIAARIEKAIAKPGNQPELTAG
jgi:hypothetical protein